MNSRYFARAAHGKGHTPLPPVATLEKRRRIIHGLTGMNSQMFNSFLDGTKLFLHYSPDQRIEPCQAFAQIVFR